MALHMVDHPLAKHLLAGLRDLTTPPDKFRQFADTLSTILILEATRSLRSHAGEVETPLEVTHAHRLGQGLAVVPILRAGMSMLDPALRLFPRVSVGFVGLERSHETATAHSYYCNLPDLKGLFTLCCDPMLATGGSASQAISLLKEGGAEQVVMVCVVCAPEGVAKLEADHPDVPVFTAALDSGLNDQKYIVPGLGDYGDRLYGTE